MVKEGWETDALLAHQGTEKKDREDWLRGHRVAIRYSSLEVLSPGTLSLSSVLPGL